MQPSGSLRAPAKRRRVSQSLSVAFFITLLVSLSCYVINQRAIVSGFRQGPNGLASTLTFVPQLNLSQEFPSPSLGLLTFLISGAAVFIFTLTALHDGPVSVRLTAATIVSTSYVIATHEALDCLPPTFSPMRISDSSLGVLGLLTLVTLVCVGIFRSTAAKVTRPDPPQRRRNCSLLSWPTTTESQRSKLQ